MDAGLQLRHKLIHSGQNILAFRRVALRYFFHVVSPWKIYPDERGEDLAGNEAARAYAELISGELAVDAASYPGFAVRILDETGTELGWVPIGSKL
jgi:hypothetical protein